MMNQVKIRKGEISIMLVMIVMMLSVITTAAVALAFSTSYDTTTLSLGEKALAVAESGAENAILRLLRDSSYAGETNLSIGPGNATITVTGSTPIIIVSTAVVGNLTRAVQVEATYVNGQLVVGTWKEI